METISTQPLLDKGIEVIRPLLSISKGEIENYCLKNDIKFFEDKTNFDTSTSLRNKLRHDFIIPLSKLGKDNSFFQSRNTIYNSINNTQNQNYLLPIKTCPYRNANSAYKRAIPQNMITSESLANILSDL
jgi:tRNA(Ile)-lysidine synthase TilS/MesJ